MSTDPSCIFCKIVAGEIPCFKLWEDESSLSFMDINPAAPGHALVIPKGHAPNLFAMSDDAMGAVARTLRRVSVAIERTVAPDGFSVVQANGPGAAQSVPHFHFHMIPRTHGDDLKINWEMKTGQDLDAIRTLAERIRANL